MEAIWICIVDVAGISNAHIRAWATDADRAEQLREQDLDMVEYRPASDIDRITAERDGLAKELLTQAAEIVRLSDERDRAGCATHRVTSDHGARG